MSSKTLKKIPAYFILIVAAIATIAPFYFMISISLKPDDTITQFTFFPKPLIFSNYPWIFAHSNMLLGFFNSIKVTFLVIVGQLISDSMAAYAFSKLEFKGKKFIYGTLISTMMLPTIIMLVPQYVLISKLHLVNTLWSLILPQIFVNAYGVFLMSSFMVGLPNSYIESAKIDGAKELTIFLRVIFPMSKPALATIGLFIALGYWNDFFSAMLFITNESLLPLQYYLYRMVNTVEALNRVASMTGMAVPNMPKQTLKLAMTVLVVLPVMCVYPFAQRFIVGGVTLGAVKG